MDFHHISYHNFLALKFFNRHIKFTVPDDSQINIFLTYHQTFHYARNKAQLWFACFKVYKYAFSFYELSLLLP